MPRKGEKRDPLLDCEIIKIYRDVVHLQMNYLQRQFVVEKVSCCERGLALWRATLKEWMLNGFNPKGIPGMVKLWEGNFWAVEGNKFKRWEPNENGNH